MATEADIPVPICETRGEQVENFVDNIINISVSKLSLEKQSRDDKFNEHPTVEGENFLRPPSTGEVQSQVYNVSPDVSKVTEETDQAVEAAASEEEQIQKHAEESNSTEKDGDIATDSSVDDPDANEARVVTQLSKDTSSDHHGTNVSFTQNIALTKEILQETTESHAPSIPEGEELIFQVKTTDNKSEDVKPTEDVKSDQNKSTSEQATLTNETSVENNSNTAAEEVRQENSTSTETTTTLESDLNSSFPKEEEMVATSEDHVVPLENTLSESHEHVECQPKTLDDAATDHSEPELAEKSEESLFVQVEEESERLPLTQVSTTDNVKDKDEDLKEAELFENEPSTRSTSLKEDMKIETPAQSLHVAAENIEVSDLRQENSIEEQSTKATLHGNTIEAEEAKTDAVDREKESLESCPPVVSSPPKDGSMNAILQEVTSDHTDEKLIDEVNKHTEVLENISVDEAHSGINNVTEKFDQTVRDGTDTLLLSPKLDDQPVEFAANEQTSVEEIHQNAEESNSTEKDGDRVVVLEQCSTDSSVVTSEMNAGDALDDPDMDDARVVTRLSKDTSSDHHGTNDSFTENFALTKEILEETNIPSVETESHAPCISEGEELNVQVSSDNKSEEVKPTDEDLSSNLISEVSKEGESDQNKTTSEQEALENERSVEDTSNIVAEAVSQENSASTDTITTLETSNNDELQSKSDLNSSFCKEVETTAEKGDRSVTTSEDYGGTLENTLSESHGDEECQSKTLEDTAIDHSDPKLAEKYEESSLVQIEDSQIECDEHLEKESERLTLTGASTGGTNDNVSEAIDKVKDEGEDLKEVELSENEQSTRCTLVKEDEQIEHSAESLHVTPESTEVFDLRQENNIKGILEEQSTNATLHGNTIEAEEVTIDAADRQKESHESFSPIVSSSPEDGVLQEVTSDHTDKKTIGEVDKHTEVLENLSIGEAHSEINNVAPDISEVTEKSDQTVRDDTDTLLISPILDDQSTEFAANEETYVEEIQQNAEESNSTEKDGDKGVVPEQCSTDSSVVTSEMKAGDTLDDPDVDDARVVTQLSKDTSSDRHITNESFTENIALTKEILQETESHAPCIPEGEELNVQVKTTDNKSEAEKPTEEENLSCNLTSEVSKEEESNQNKMTSEQEALANERVGEDNSNTAAEEVSQENRTSTETITTLETSNIDELQSKSDLNSSFSNEEGTTVQKGDRSVDVATEDSGFLLENTLSESHGDEECQSKTLEDAATDHSDPMLAEQSEESSHGQVDTSQIERDEQLEEESERLLLTEASTGGTNDNVSEAIDKVKDEGGDLKEVELSEIEQSTRCTWVKEDVQIEHSAESLHVAPESTEVFDLRQENNIKGLLEEQSTDSNLHENSIEEEEATINEVVDQQKECLESFQPIVTSSPEEGSMTAILQEVTRDHADNIIEEVDKHTEVLENLSTTEDAEGNSLIKLEGSENKNEDDLGKESENTSLPLPLAREVSDESKFLHEAQLEDGESKKVELCDNERSTESISLKTESRTDNTKDSLHDTSEDNKAPDLGQEIETRSAIEDKDLSTPPQGMLDKRSDSEIVDAAETKEETLENVPTIVSNEEHLEKENLEVSLIKDNTGNANNEVVIVNEEAKIEDGNLSGAELSDKDKKTECVLLTEEVQSEKAVESLHATFEDVKAADCGHHTEAIGILQEQIPAENSQGIPSDETEGKVIDAVNTIEKTQELQNVSNEESDKGLLIEGNASETILGTNLEEETERPSLTEASKEDPNDEEEKSRDLQEKLQNAPEDHKTSTSSEDRETTLSLEEQSLAENSQAIISNTIIDEADKELALENVAAQIPHDQHLEKDIQNSSFTEETNTNTRESNEPKTGVKDSIKSELENEENTESTYVQEEEDVEKPGDIKQHDSSLDINNSIEGIQEQIPTTDPREISNDDTVREPVDVANTNEESLEDIAKNIPDCDQDENISVEESPENTEGDLIKEEDSIESFQVAAQDIDTPTLGQGTEQSSITNPEGIINDNKEDIADNADGSEDETLKDKNTSNTTLYEDKEDCSRLEQNDDLGNARENAPFGEAPTVYTTESSPVKEEEQVEKHVKEPILTVDAANERNDVVVNVPNEDNSPIEVDGSQKPSFEEVPAEKINDDEPTAIHEATDEDIKATSSVQDREASHLEEQAPTTDSPGTTGDHNDTKTLHLADPKEETVEDKNYATTPYEDTKEDSLTQVDGSLTSLTDAPKDDITESILVREVAQVEDPIDSLHAATEDIKAFAPCQDTGISSTENQIQDPEDISSNKITEKTIEATGEEILDAEDIAKSVPHEEDSPNVEPSLVEGLMGNFDEHESTMHKVEFVDESFIKADLLENEKNTEATLIKEDVSIELPQVAAEDIKEPCLSEVTETNSEEEQILSANPGGLVDDNKTIDPIVFQKEIPKDEVPKEMESVDVKATPIELKEEEGYLKNLQMTTAVNLVAAHNASEDVSESEEVNDEEKTDSVASQKVSTSNVALEEDSTSNSSQEPRRETREKTETGEAQKQESVLQDSSVEKIERDAQLCLASANDSGINEEVQKLKEVSLPAPEENIVETTDHKEIDAVEGATNNKDIDHLEQSDTTKSFSDDKKSTEEELEETVANDVLPVSSSDTPGVDHSTFERELTNREEPCTDITETGDDEEIKIHKGDNDEKEACDQKISDISSTAPDMIEARDTDAAKSTNNSDSIIDTTEVPTINENTGVECILVNERSVIDLETKNDDEAPEIKETTPSSAEGQDVESASVEENSNYLTEEKSDSNEVAFAPGENISGYESNNRVLESIAQVQSCDIISETEETIIEEENLKAEAEIPKDEVPKEIEIVDVKETPIELKEEEGYLKDLQMTTAANLVAAHQEKSSNITFGKTPYAEDLDANEDVIGHNPEVSNYKQQESSITKVSEEHMTTSNEHVSDNASLKSEVSEKNDQVDGDKTDSEKVEVLNDGSIAVPTNETLEETDPRGSIEAEVPVPKGEKDAEIDQKNINEALLHNASEDVSKSEEVNGEEKTNSVASQEVSTAIVALEEDLTSKSSQEPRRETRENTETEEAQKQESVLQDPSVQKIERDAQSYLASANDSGITEEVQKLQEVPLPAPEENIVETINCKESDVVEGATNNEDIDHPEQNDTTKSFSDDKKPTEEELEETVANDVLPVSSSETPGVDHSTTERELTNREEPCTEKTATGDDEEIKIDKGENNEKEACEEKISDISSTAPDMIEARDTDVSNSSEKEQLLRSEAEDEDIKDYDRGSCEEEVITDSHQEEVVKQEQQKTIKETVEFIKNGNETETVAKVSEEADDKAPKDLEEKVLTNEAIDRILHREEQEKSIEGPTTKLDAEKAHELDVVSVKTDTQDSNQEGVHIAIIPDEESEEQNNKDEICSSDKVQAKHEENVVLSEGKSEDEAKEIDTWTKPNEDGDKETYVEAKKLDFASQTKGISECVVSDGSQDIPEDNGNSTTKDKFSGEDYPSKSTEFEVSSASEDISLTEQASEATIVTAEVQEAKAGIDLGASVPKATGIESRKVEEVNDDCAAMADTSTPVEPPVISTSKIIPCTVETPLHVSEDVQELRKESFEVSKHENPEEKIESSEGQETKPIQNAPVSETLEQETEQQELGRGTEDVHEEQKKIYNIPNQLESSYGAETEKVPESSICQSSVEDTAQHDEKEGSRQIDPPASLPQAQCSDIKTSEKDLPVHVAELEAPPLPLKDKHVVLEADDTRNLNPEDLGGNKNVSTEYSQGEHEKVKPSKVEQEEAECGNEERTDQEREEKAELKETGKSSLSDLFHVSTRGKADHSATEKEAQDLHAEHSDEAEHENSKTDDEEGSHEQRRSDSGSEAPVMVDMADVEVKVAHKKSHNILSGVGSKVKHSIAKVKKAITGKSSHTKPPSPKKVTN